MFDHVGLIVKDLEAALRFYRAVLDPLGHVAGYQDATCGGGPA